MLHPLDCRFRDAETEARYRAEYADADRRAATITALVALVPMLGFFVADLGLFARATMPVPLILARLGMVALSVALVARLRWPLEPGSLDRLMLGWWLLLALLILYVGTTRPPGELLHRVIDPAVVLLACVVPLTALRLQLVPGLVLSGGNLLTALAAQGATAADTALLAVSLSCFVMLAVGYGCGWHLHAMRRGQFAALQAQLELQQRVEDLASTDALTALPNRHQFLERAAVELARALRHARALSLLVIDIDHFKRINDTWGHAAGDRALAEVARALAVELRGQDLLARMGGTEFAVLMPETPATRAAQVAERLRARCATLEWLAGDSTARLTLSIGVATHGADDGELASLLRRADAALHEARHEGRDRVIAA